MSLCNFLILICLIIIQILLTKILILVNSKFYYFKNPGGTLPPRIDIISFKVNRLTLLLFFLSLIFELLAFFFIVLGYNVYETGLVCFSYICSTHPKYVTQNMHFFLIFLKLFLFLTEFQAFTI
jgi:hypothetical protein